MPFAFATTHVRHDQFFLAKWLAHYGAIVGRDNLFVTLDGDDWQPRVDLTGFGGVETLTDTPDKRVRHDRFIAKHMSNRVQAIRRAGRYVHAIRTDVDEYVVLDPATGLDWEGALADHRARGYAFALGIDVFQRPCDRPSLDRTAPVLRQRNGGLLSAVYSKPFTTSRWAMWSGGAHRLQNRDVAIDPRFVLVHLAQCDRTLARERLAARGGSALHASYRAHLSDRFDLWDRAITAQSLSFDAVRDLAAREFGLSPDGAPIPRPRKAVHPDAVEHGFAVSLPERFHDLV